MAKPPGVLVSPRPCDAIGAADGWRLAASSGRDSAFCSGYRGDGLPQTDSLPIRSAVDRGGGLPHPISNTTARRVHRWGGILPWPRTAYPLLLTMSHHGQAWRACKKSFFALGPGPGSLFGLIFRPYLGPYLGPICAHIWILFRPTFGSSFRTTFGPSLRPGSMVGPYLGPYLAPYLDPIWAYIWTQIWVQNWIHI